MHRGLKKGVPGQCDGARRQETSDGLRHTSHVLDQQPKEKTMTKEHRTSSQAQRTLVLGATGVRTGQKLTHPTLRN